MPKLVFVMNLHERHIARVRDVVPDWEIVASRDPSIWLTHLKDAMVVGGWNEHVMASCVNDDRSEVRWIHNWGAGVDQLPFEKLAQRQIIVTNSSGVHAFPISETILGMMLALTRKLHTYVWNQTRKQWHHGQLSLEMHGKTVGILGVGAIGLETARLCKAFGMRVLGLRRSGDNESIVDQMYDMNGLHALLEASDYVINTLPLTSETRGLMDGRAFARMKPTAFYINIGRGATTDEAALVDALVTKQIAGAGLDVFVTEPLPTDSPLWNLEQVIVTPHTAGSTTFYDDRVMDIFVPNLEAFVQGLLPSINRVDLSLQY